ncbi:MAG TPA: hypothetical protein VFA04_04295 [Bryobacteraceae bacterium]|nr:hypothetical protein [Bryobacteraceae bacterium]
MSKGAETGDQKDPQTSNKSGSHSTVEKEQASRPGFGKSPGYMQVPGAHGDPAHPKSEGSANRLNDGSPGDPDNPS